MLDNFEQIDEFEFDARVLASLQRINEINIYRFPHLESNYFNDKHIELIFNFRVSYKDRKGDIEEYLEECATIMEDTISMIVDEMSYEGITPDSI